MRVPRVSIRGLLVIIAILAVDLAALVSWNTPGSWRTWNRQILSEMLPAFNVLAVMLLVLASQISRRGECSPFLAGFQAVGSAALVMTLVARIALDASFYRFEQWAEGYLTDFWFRYIKSTGVLTYAHSDMIRWSFQIVAVAVLPLLLGLLGGWASSRLGIQVIKGEPRSDRPREIPARRAFVLGLTFLVIGASAVWGAGVYARWQIYRAHLDGAIAGEPIFRDQYERTLQEISALDESTDGGEDADDRAQRRKELVESARRDLEQLKRYALIKFHYGPAVRRPWLPIPPNPPLYSFELKSP